ncbi:hypothetical protein [endosymbiont GvMRE of Glomus versiforme]|uniref:hypothetical protein n=1 Tax=endosymbiont GvMRE of Glomus versiforme TaxID=2039283 RepID=UPI000EC3FDE8|nr:hypothetical protein [endosymbiont GvMRE of Glomus versiforme]RHZ35743.1 hypothetical protein GvMRE_Ic6g51 [endosymbiont GvMRE of Glomus versiforme]
MENNALINFPDDNEFNKLLLTYTLFKKVLSKVGKIDIKFDYLTLFFDTVQIEEEKKTKIIQKIAEKNIVDNSYKYDDCSISFFNNVIQQSDQELVSSERGVYSLLGNQTNNYSILVCLIPEKIESFVTKKIKDIEEEFTKKYEKYGSIDSWIIDELRLNKAFAHAFELSYKGKIAIPKQPTT